MYSYLLYSILLRGIHLSLVRQGLFLFDRTATISMNRKLLIHRKGKKSLFDGEKCLTSDELKPVTFPKTLPSAECPAQPKIEELCLKYFLLVLAVTFFIFKY